MPRLVCARMRSCAHTQNHNYTRLSTSVHLIALSGQVCGFGCIRRVPTLSHSYYSDRGCVWSHFPTPQPSALPSGTGLVRKRGLAGHQPRGGSRGLGRAAFVHTFPPPVTSGSLPRRSEPGAGGPLTSLSAPLPTLTTPVTPG